mmetsp:Transcript_31532/g.76271  ORF Transcript_31532/g.76271 Transcript_31532/m.76271 type:complete len:263 (+) Transcript_31532:538-1326(+)
MNGGETLQALLIVLIPEIHNAITSYSRKRPITLMKADAIHRVHITSLPVALECKRILPVNFGHIMNAHPPLNTSHGISGRIGKGSNAPTLKLQGTFLPLMLLRLTLDIVRYYVPPRGCHDHQTIPHVQIITLLRKLQCSHGIGLSCIPKFKHFIPASRDDQISRGKKCHGFDGLIMRTDLLRDVVGWTLTKLPHAHGLIGSDGEDGAPIGGEAGIEHGRVVFVVHLCLGQCADLTSTLLNLPTSYTAIPIRGHQMIGRGAPI